MTDISYVLCRKGKRFLSDCDPISELHSPKQCVFCCHGVFQKSGVLGSNHSQLGIIVSVMFAVKQTDYSAKSFHAGTWISYNTIIFNQCGQTVHILCSSRETLSMLALFIHLLPVETELEQHYSCNSCWLHDYFRYEWKCINHICWYMKPFLLECGICNHELRRVYIKVCTER